MGAWGTGSFENDSAWNWVNDFVHAPGWAIIRDALTSVTDLSEEEYLEVDECGAAIAAAEILAALNKRPHPDLPEDLARWVNAQKARPPVDAALIQLTIRALQRIDTLSEVQESWDESESAADFHRKMNDLETRVAKRILPRLELSARRPNAKRH